MKTGIMKIDQTTFVLCGLIFVLLIALYYMNTRNISVANNAGLYEPFSNNLEAGENEVVLVLFYVDWCPHCKNFKPTWEKATKKLNNTTINGNKVRLESVNCEEDPETGKKYDVEGYPTIMAMTSGGPQEFNGDRSLSGIKEYLNNL